MTPEGFLALFTPFPEPYLLLTHRGEILAANPAAVRRLGGTGRGVVGTALASHLSSGAERLPEYLAACSRSRSLVLGALVLSGSDGAGGRLRAEGAVVRAAEAGDGEALIILRLQTSASGANQFALLTRKVQELTGEMRVRHRVAEERAALLRQTREDRARWRLLAEASAAISGSLDPREIARVLTRLVVRELADASELELRLPGRPTERVGAQRSGEGGSGGVATSGTAVAARIESAPAPAPSGANQEVLAVGVPGPDGDLGTFRLWRRAGAAQPFDDDTRALIVELTRRAGSAIHTAWLFGELQSARDELEMQAEELQQLTEELEQSLDELQNANAALETRVTEAKEAEAAAVEARRVAEQARAEADASNRAKAEFLAMMSHELRTPLNAIGGYAQLLELGVRGELSDAQREDVRRIQASQRHLLGIINDILNFARLESGQVTYDIAPTPLAGLVERLEPLIAPQVAARRLRFEVSGGPDVSVLADGEKLQQILINLLSNAIKFTDPGGRIELSWDHDAEHVRIRILDTGIGIAASRHEKVFEPFVQLRSTRGAPFEGTGLGLAISRDLARAMGGDIGLESREGAGSTFIVVLRRSAER